MDALQLSNETLKVISSLDPSWLKKQRQDAWRLFSTVDLPTTKIEEFRRTDLKGLNLSRFSTSDKETLRWEIDAEWQKRGVIASTLSEALVQNPELVEPYLGKLSRQNPWKLKLLHSALWQGGLFLYIPKNVRFADPIRAISLGNRDCVAQFPHILIVLEEGAEAFVIEELIGEGEGEQLVIPQTEIVLKSGAKLKYANLQRLNRSSWCFSDVTTQLFRNSSLNSLVVFLGGKVTKADFTSTLLGEGANSQMLGLAFGDGNQHFDLQTFQNHVRPETLSDLLYKTILKGKATSIYKGLIRIEKSGQKSNAYQNNQNLLLSERARADSQPKLEIIADDVRCTHGATVGTVDEEQLFYLRSRGLKQEEAENLITRGFCEEVLQRFDSGPFTEWLMTDLERKL
ncbi:MAG TPA: Fe-S cluster assembly protein SufD [Bdellovibrionota bacterium]|nr:Fe-S cluster assembly protein SufD [Bdellovibrionota bacterium]